MKRSRRRHLLLPFAALSLLVAGLGCGENPTDGGPIVIQPPPPFKATEVFLRPLVITVPPAGGGRPVPSLAAYNLTAFFVGGMVTPTFDWTVPAAIGTVVPKTPQLTIRDAAVTLQIRADGSPPLGFFAVTAAGHSAAESSTATARFAVVRNTWMKHRRLGWVEPEPDDPVSWPTFLPNLDPNAPASSDTILFVQHENGQRIRLKRIPAFAPLGDGEQVTDDVVLLPASPAGNNFEVAAQSAVDASPAGFARREVLFASRMDSQYGQRCPTGPLGCTPAPLNLWVGRAPGGIALSQPRQITFDSSFVDGPRTRWYAFNYEQPRWDPSTIGGEARIAFIGDTYPIEERLNPNRPRQRDVWTAVLRDTTPPGAFPPDPTSDVLVDVRRLTQGGGVAGLDWDPDGTRLCVSRGNRLEWVDLISGAAMPIQLPASPMLNRILAPTVYRGSGQTTPLIAFQAETENEANIYVLDEAAQTLTKVLPFPVPVTHNLFPRWHPRRKAIVYVSDYTVETWANTTPPRNSPVPDVLNPTNPEIAGMRRTRYPSPWAIQLE